MGRGGPGDDDRWVPSSGHPVRGGPSRRREAYALAQTTLMLSRRIIDTNRVMERKMAMAVSP